LGRRESRNRRHKRIRKHLRGSTDRPRLCIFRSAKHIYAQVVDDDKGVVLFGCSTRTPSLKETMASMRPQEASKEVGKHLAKVAQEHGVERVCFDRGGYRFHGRIKALAEGAREAGLGF
jgi:large subunit ribosomal protein L18